VTEEPNEWNIAVCGLNCAKCPIYQAYHRRDINFQQRISTQISNDAFTCPQKPLNAMAAMDILPFIGVLSARLNHVLQKKAIHIVTNVIVFHVIN